MDVAQVLEALDQAVAELTYGEIEQHLDNGEVRTGEQVPLLERSIGHDLRRIDLVLGAKRSGTLLTAIGVSIGAALLHIEEARQLLREDQL